MSIPKLEFPPFHLPDEAEALRGEVRAFLKETLPALKKTEDRFASWNTLLARVQQGVGQEGMDRHHLAQAVRRQREELPRPLRHHRGASGQQRAGRRPLGRRPPVGAVAAALRQRGAAPGDPAAHHRRRMLFLDRHERARLGLRPRLGAHTGRACPGRLPGQRHQGLDLGRPSQPLLHRAGAHLGPARRPPQGTEPDPGRPQDAGHHHPADHQSRRPARLERGDLQRRLHPRELPDRQRGRRLAAGDERACLRALRPRALHAELLRPARAGARAGPPARQARQRDPRPPDRAAVDLAADVGRRRRHDAGRQVAGHRGGAGQGSRHDLPAGPAGDRPHHRRIRRHDRGGHGRFPRRRAIRHHDGAVLHHPGRHDPGAARHRRARPRFSR